jgi:hypothetical protein
MLHRFTCRPVHQYPGSRETLAGREATVPVRGPAPPHTSAGMAPPHPYRAQPVSMTSSLRAGDQGYERLELAVCGGAWQRVRAVRRGLKGVDPERLGDPEQLRVAQLLHILRYGRCCARPLRRSDPGWKPRSEADFRRLIRCRRRRLSVSTSPHDWLGTEPARPPARGRRGTAGQA